MARTESSLWGVYAQRGTERVNRDCYLIEEMLLDTGYCQEFDYINARIMLGTYTNSGRLSYKLLL